MREKLTLRLQLPTFLFKALSLLRQFTGAEFTPDMIAASDMREKTIAANLIIVKKLMVFCLSEQHPVRCI
jgi:hypothetical protein